MTIDDFKTLYFHNDSSEKKKEVLFKMADIYRGMIEHESHLINYRTTWFLTLNGFLFAAFGIILAYYKGSHEFLISISLAFTFVGYVLAFWVYKEGIDAAGKARIYIHTRWLLFLKTFFDYSLPPALSKN